ncbi:MAG: TIGR04255 family protein [Nitrospirota bacterium]
MDSKLEEKLSSDRSIVPERRYHKSPVIEALCEICFVDSEWDDTVPGAFYERIKKEFPRKQQRMIQEAQITLGQGQAAAGVRQLPPWMQFVSDDKHRMIQIARDLIVVNQQAPYPHFEEWEPDVCQALEIYRELAKPPKVSRLGLRYINYVLIPEETVSMQDYFTIYPTLPQGLGNTHHSFMVRVDVPQGEGRSMLITFGVAPLPDSGQKEQAFLLDFYHTLQIDKPIDAATLKREIKQAHENIIVAFEDSITDRLRTLFEPKDQS